MRVAVRPARKPNLALAGALTLGLGVFIVVSGLAAGLFMVSPGNGSASGILARQPGAIPWDGRRPLTVLLIGAGNHQAASSFTIASLDPVGHRLGLLALPPNLWLTIPGNGQATLASAYAAGGTALARLAAESATGAFIPYELVMSPAAGRALLNEIGGSPTLDHHAGKRLSANGALRTFNRLGFGARNRVIRAGIRSSAHTFPLDVLPSFLNAVGTAIQTNVPYSRAPAILNLLETLPPANVRTARADSPPMTAPYQTYLLPDLSRLQSVAAHVLRPYRVPYGVRILNASGVTGQAGALATWLQQFNINVIGYATASTSNLAHTRVAVGRSAAGPVQAGARDLADLLDVPVKTVSGHSGATVLIGHDFRSPTQH